MIYVNVATSNIRGFLKNLFDYPFQKIKFVYENNTVYEVPKVTRKLLSKGIKLKVFDILGVYQIVDAESMKEDISFSYNRFLKTKKPYIILLENPSALVNYCWDRPKYRIARRKLKNCFQDTALYEIVCMSRACYDSLNHLYNFMDLSEVVNISQIYPLVIEDISFSQQDMKARCYCGTVECLFVSSDYLLKGGRDILFAFRELEKKNIPIHLTLITRLQSIPKEDFEEIQSMRTISFQEFNLSKKELDEYYKKAAVLVYPTRHDSYSLVVLEAIKYGEAVVGTDVYAIREMVHDGENGYLKSPMFCSWMENGLPDRSDVKYRKKYFYTGILDEALIEWMIEKLISLAENRDELYRMNCNSFRIARNEDFSQKEIIDKWEALISKAAKKH